MPRKKKNQSLTVTNNKPLEIALNDKEKFQQLIKQSMPEFVQKIETKEDLGNAMYASAQEMLLAIIDVLIRYHKFTEEDITKFNKEVKDILSGVKEFEERGLSILTPHSMGIVGEKVQEMGIEGLLTEIAGIRFQKERMVRSGLEQPILTGAEPFLKRLKQKNDGKL